MLLSYFVRSTFIRIVGPLQNYNKIIVLPFCKNDRFVKESLTQLATDYLENLFHVAFMFIQNLCTCSFLSMIVFKSTVVTVSLMINTMYSYQGSPNCYK